MIRRRFQFSIRWLMAWTAVVATWLALWMADPSRESPIWLGATILVMCLAFPPFCGIAYFEAKGAIRAFWFGALFVLTVTTFAILSNLAANVVGGGAMPGELNEIVNLLGWVAYDRHIMLLFVAIAPGVGLLCMGFYWVLTRSKLSEDR
ncbi:MAG TPA: hypothetical protein VGX76_00805 [Pirellulales bacterium]|jgi:hypothetical protein|nr:hypothetical protein [Pirellulales bacterium]